MHVFFVCMLYYTYDCKLKQEAVCPENGQIRFFANLVNILKAKDLAKRTNKMTARKIYTFKLNDSTPNDHLGRVGEITYRDGYLYYHNGVTVGGEVIGGGSGSGSTSWASVTGKPSFATVATSGSYADLTGTPSIVETNQTLNTGDSVSFNRLTVTGASGIEGGEIQLAKAPNSTLAGDVIIDVYENKLRFFEGGGTGRGFYLDLTTGANNTNTNIMSGGDSFSGSYNDLTDKPALFSGDYDDLTDKPTYRIAVATGSGPGGNLQADSLALAGLNPVTNIPSTWGGDLILQGGVGGANSDLYGEVRIKSGQIGANYEWHFTTDKKIKLPAGGNIVDSTGATAFVSLATLKQVVADSTDFADFKSRIAGM